MRRDNFFIAIDHEGGRVCRTPAPLTRYSYASEWATNAAAVGACMGQQLASIGVNLNFAPVLDIHSNPNNPVIGKRAFGETANLVSGAAVGFMRALEGNGVRACGKHFPGHGDTQVDSHRELPVLHLSLQELRTRELVPFQAAIAADIGMIMTSHIMFPELDGDMPVTLSAAITHELLRKHCQFEGVIVSDDVGMHAMDGLLDKPASMLTFMEAGNDMMMICSHWTDTDRARGFAGALLDARSSSGIGRMLDSSKQRVRTMLASTPMNPIRMLSADRIAGCERAGALFRAETVEVV
jgi:beta-N-acetylhexosaminidase